MDCRTGGVLAELESAELREVLSTSPLVMGDRVKLRNALRQLQQRKLADARGPASAAN